MDIVINSKRPMAHQLDESLTGLVNSTGDHQVIAEYSQLRSRNKDALHLLNKCNDVLRGVHNDKLFNLLQEWKYSWSNALSNYRYHGLLTN